MTLPQDTQDAPVSVEQAVSDASPSEPSVEQPDSAPSSGLSKDERDRLAAMGREAATARRRADAAEKANAQLQQQVAQLGQIVQGTVAEMSERKRLERDAYLASLPIEKKVAYLQGEVDRLRTPAPAREPQRPAPQPVADRYSGLDEVSYMNARSVDVLTEINRRFGLDGTSALTMETPGLDWDDEASFTASAILTAKRAAKEKTVASPNKQPSNAPAKEQPKAPEAADLDKKTQDMIDAAVDRALGIGRPNSPKPAGGGTAPVGTAQLNSIARSYDPAKGPKGTLEQLKAARAELAKGVATGK